MVDAMKKQMRRFEHLIGFEGRLDVTSRESMKRLISALDSRYKNDIENSIRLHRLEFFHDLVEGRRKRKEKTAKRAEAPVKKRKREKSDEKEEEGQKEDIPEKPTETDQTDSDEVLSIRAADVDDWKDLMTLSKIYYALEHPRSEGLKWKRKIAKKKNIGKFTDKDFIEWRVTQNFRLRGLEEWAQRKSDARKLAEQQHFDMDEIESDDDVKELEQLYEMFDPSGRKYKSKERTEKPKKVLSTADRPFKFKDEGMEDWIESYSDDSEYSDEHFAEVTDDFTEESERKISESEEEKKDLTPEEEEDITELFSKYPEFIRYREDIFKRMEKAETTEEWFKLYFESCSTPHEMEITQRDAPLMHITEDEEESGPERDEGGKRDKLKEIAEEAESESEITESLLQNAVNNVIEKLVEKITEPREKSDVETEIVDKEMYADIKSVIERIIPIPEEETSRQNDQLESQLAAEEEKQTESKSLFGKEIHFPEKETSEKREKLKTERGIAEEDMDPEIKSLNEQEILISKEETVGEKEQLESQTGSVDEKEQPEKEYVTEKMIQIPEDETIEKREQLIDSQMGIGEREKKPETGSVTEEGIQILDEKNIEKAEQLESQMEMGQKPEAETESVIKELIQIPEEENMGKTEQLETQMGMGEEREAKTESVFKEGIQIPEEETMDETDQLESQMGMGEEEITAKETILIPEEINELKEQAEVENETVETPTESMAKEEAQMLTEPRQNIDSEIEKIKDGENPNIEAASKEDETDSLKDVRTEVHKDVEKHEETTNDVKSDNTLKKLEQTQETENTSDEKADSLQDTTSAIGIQSEGHGVEKMVNKGNEIADTAEEPLIEMSEPQTEQLTSESGRQENNGYKPDTVEKEKSKEIIKPCSAKQHRRKPKIKRSVSYSLFPTENDTEPSFSVKRSDSQESVILCSVCAKSINDIPSQDTDEDDGSSSETDSKTEEDAEDEKGTESE